MIARFIIAILLLLAVDWYAFQAVRIVLAETPSAARVAVYVVYWSIPVLAIAYLWSAGRGGANRWPEQMRVIVRTLIVIVYFSKLLVALVMLADDVRRVVQAAYYALSGDNWIASGRSRFMSELGLGLGILPLVFLTYGMVRNPYRYKVHRHRVTIPGLPAALDGFRIVQISDIHAGSFLTLDPVRKSVKIINRLDPDLVVFTGDLVNTTADEADAIIPIFSGIRARYGVFSVLGNHDYGDYRPWPSQAAKQANFQRLIEQHARLGWHLLRNEHAVVRKEDAAVGVIGVENYSAHPRFHKYGDMPRATAGMPEVDVTILLSHDPSHWRDEIIRAYPQVDLTLSGHTHGFQFGIEIPGLIKWSPVQYVYKQWAGLYQQGAQYLYVNRGLGYLGYPGRVGILPEITELTLTRAQGG